VFNSHYSDRIKEWKEYREQLETSNDPLQDVAEFWALAPFVNSYLNPNNSKEWPDPWKLILDGKYDDLAIVLGMLYTISLLDHADLTDAELVLTETGHNLVLVSKRKYILNWDRDRIVNTNQKLEIKQCLTQRQVQDRYN
jgi:hypothetical protein